MTTREKVGQPFIGPDIEAIKTRVDAQSETKKIFDQFDVTDPQQYMALATNGYCTVLADEQALPHVVYALATLLTSTMRMAETADNPSIGLYAKAAMLQAMQDSSSENTEVQDNEDNPS